ncbi:MAG TPA: hypothetical protein VGO97_05535, partial [Solirubrobacterales bacterium]|nr:hypothetical protein [Solirubrobacterales bacterium]
YRKLVGDKLDVATANYAVQAYVGLEDATNAKRNQLILARLDENPNNYLALMRFAIAAGDQRMANLSEIKAKQLAEPAQMPEVVAAIKELKDLSAQQTAELNQQIQEQLANQTQAAGGGGSALSSPFGGLSPQSGGQVVSNAGK